MQCPKTFDILISEPCDSLSSFASMLSNVKCWGDSSAKAYVNGFGGAEPWTYSYQWHNAPFGISGNGEANDTAYYLWADNEMNLFPNTFWHTVTITDPNGCTVEDSVEIKHDNPKIRPFYLATPIDTIWEIKFIEDSVSCYNLCDGVVSLETRGGVLPHEYVWDVAPNTIHYNNPDTAVELCAGGHNVIITDYIGCSQLITYSIASPNPIYAAATLVSPISCFGFNDGTANATAAGGNFPYTFNWFIDSITYNTSDSLLGVGQNIDSLPPGIHIIEVTDYKGCVATGEVEFIEPTELSLAILDDSTVYAYCEDTRSAKLCAQAFGGTPGYLYAWDDEYFQNNLTSSLGEDTAFCADNLKPNNINSIDGNYNVTVIDDRGCYANATINIDTITNSFNANTIYLTGSNISCYNGYNGSITIDNIIGAYSPFAFVWTECLKQVKMR